MGNMEAALDNLSLAATSDKSTVQQLTAANLALTTTVATLTATNKKLVDAAAKKQRTRAPTGAAAGAPKTPGEGWANKTFPGNYCWTHGHRVRKDNTSATCKHKPDGHKNNATAADTKGGCEDNKGRDKA